VVPCSIVEAVDNELRVTSETVLLQGLPTAVRRELDDEHRSIALGVDIDQDVAATAFLAGCPARG
jgi:hypothetical protein